METKGTVHVYFDDQFDASTFWKAKGLLIFPHVPKTGGTAIRMAFTKAFPNEVAWINSEIFDLEIAAQQAIRARENNPSLKLLIGHMPFGLHRFFEGTPCKYVSVVRDPLERIASHYIHEYVSHLFRKDRGDLLLGTSSVTSFIEETEHLQGKEVANFAHNGQCRILFPEMEEKYDFRSCALDETFHENMYEAIRQWFLLIGETENTDIFIEKLSSIIANGREVIVENAKHNVKFAERAGTILSVQDQALLQDWNVYDLALRRFITKQPPMAFSIRGDASERGALISDMRLKALLHCKEEFDALLADRQEAQNVMDHQHRLLVQQMEAYGTPKSRAFSSLFWEHDGRVSDKWEHFLSVYDRELTSLIATNDRVSILEIGVQNGGSLEIWKKLFKSGSTVVGIDIDPKIGELNFDGDIQVFVQDARDEAGIRESLGDTLFDIIIDDGSHICDDVIGTFKALFSRLKPGGIYIIEDVETSYKLDFGGGYRKDGSIVEWFKCLIDVINANYLLPEDKRHDDIRQTLDQFGSMIGRITFYDSLIVIERLRFSKTQPYRRAVAGKVAEIWNLFDAFAEMQRRPPIVFNPAAQHAFDEARNQLTMRHKRLLSDSGVRYDRNGDMNKSAALLTSLCEETFLLEKKLVWLRDRARSYKK